MKLTDIRIGAPLLRIETRIFHATPRKPTAFERVILSMAERFGNDASFNNIPIERLFVDVLCVADPIPLVTPTLSELVALDVIRCMGDIEALDALILRDIEITERGQRMISEDMLPAKSMQNDETFFYDPIRQRLLSESESKAYRPVPPKLSIDASVIEDIFPDEQIRDHIHRAGYRWFSAASHIERLESQSVQVLWKDTPCSIEIRSGELTIFSRDENLCSYLSSLESEDSYNRFIAPVFDSHDLQIEAMPALDIESLDHSTIEILPVSQALSKWPEGVRLVIPGLNHVDIAIPEKAPPHQAIIIYHEDDATEDLLFEWNEERNGCKLKVKGEHPAPISLCVTDRENLRCHRIEAKHGNEKRQLLVVCRISINREEEFLKIPLRKLSALTNQIASKDDLKAAVLWEGESQFLENQLRKLEASQIPADELVAEFYSVLADSERINGKLNRNAWTESLWNILHERISGTDGTENTSCMGLLQTLSKHGPHSEKNISRLLKTLTQRIQPPHTLDALKEIRSTFRILAPNLSFEFPSSLYTAELVKSILESFPNDFDPQLIDDDNDFSRLFASLLKLYEKISSSVGDGGIEGLNNDDDYVSLIKSKTSAGLADLSHAWASEMEALSAVLQDYGSVFGGTRLESINFKVAEIAKWTTKLIGSIDPKIHSIYVFDTSALIAQPQIVADIRPNEMFVLTKRVIEELDDKKLDESLRSNVSEVVRNLRNIKKEQIQFCDGDMSILPLDYRLKGDNLILSVAVRFRQHKPILITNDNNLSLKAQAEGIAAMTADAFVGRPRSRPQQENQSNLDRSTNPKSNQGKQRRKK
jgi:hypothetical protein